MSEIAEPWVWDDVPEYKIVVGETGEGDDRQLEYRTHIVARRGQIMTAAEVNATTSTQAGTAEASLTAIIGDTSITRTFTTGKWVCTTDHIRSMEKPSSFARREQTWEFYSAWAPIPESWEWEQDPVSGGDEEDPEE
jgi:fructose-specific component phosphotransferase system IIB-like protein